MIEEMGGVLWINEPDKVGRRMVKRYILEDFKCKFCGSSNLVMYGKYKGNQRWFCKDCKRKFAQNTALPKINHLLLMRHQQSNNIMMGYHLMRYVVILSKHTDISQLIQQSIAG